MNFIGVFKFKILMGVEQKLLLTPPLCNAPLGIFYLSLHAAPALTILTRNSQLISASNGMLRFRPLRISHGITLSNGQGKYFLGVSNQTTYQTFLSVTLLVKVPSYFFVWNSLTNLTGWISCKTIPIYCTYHWLTYQKVHQFRYFLYAHPIVVCSCMYAFCLRIAIRHTMHTFVVYAFRTNCN